MQYANISINLQNNLEGNNYNVNLTETTSIKKC